MGISLGFLWRFSQIWDGTLRATCYLAHLWKSEEFPNMQFNGAFKNAGGTSNFHQLNWWEHELLAFQYMPNNAIKNDAMTFSQFLLFGLESRGSHFGWVKERNHARCALNLMPNNNPQNKLVWKPHGIHDPTYSTFSDAIKYIACSKCSQSMGTNFGWYKFRTVIQFSTYSPPPYQGA